jgi:hypothetical protein
MDALATRIRFSDTVSKARSAGTLDRTLAELGAGELVKERFAALGQLPDVSSAGTSAHGFGFSSWAWPTNAPPPFVAKLPRTVLDAVAVRKVQVDLVDGLRRYTRTA